MPRTGARSSGHAMPRSQETFSNVMQAMTGWAGME